MIRRHYNLSDTHGKDDVFRRWVDIIPTSDQREGRRCDFETIRAKVLYGGAVRREGRPDDPEEGDVTRAA